MGKRRFALKLFGVHAMMSFLQIFIFDVILRILPDNQMYQWFVSLFLLGLFWFLIYMEANTVGQKDIKRGVYLSYKGFMVGMLASIPGFILYIVSLLYPPGIIFLRLWLISYMKIMNSLEFLMPHLALMILLLFPVVSGLSYLDSTRKHKKLMETIKASEAQRGEKSKKNL